ncbi:MAG TPA: VanZ family protein [Vicinamibacteria bacterium]|nr:VanZ family protein [Vicinamibacteria bacterium]
MERLLSLWGPPFAWMAVIFYSSAQSETGRLGRVPDWITHGAAYFLLGLLLCRALAGGFAARLQLHGALLAVAIAVVYGVCDEWHQSFVPSRESSAADVAKDAGGCALAVLLRQWHFERKR